MQPGHGRQSAWGQKRIMFSLSFPLVQGSNAAHYGPIIDIIDGILLLSLTCALISQVFAEPAFGRQSTVRPFKRGAEPVRSNDDASHYSPSVDVRTIIVAFIAIFS